MHRILPDFLDKFDGVDLLALAVLMFILSLSALGGLSLQDQMIRMIVYACVATMFGTKFIKSRRRVNEE